jgi:hypothetical protein
MSEPRIKRIRTDPRGMFGLYLEAFNPGESA